MTFGLVEQIAHYKAVKHRLLSKASYEETERAKALLSQVTPLIDDKGERG